MENPAYHPGNGLPERLVVSGAGLSTATLGGIITNTALRGVTFGPGGVPRQFNYGPLTSDPYTQGGDWQSNQFNSYNTLDQQITRENLFSYSSYELTDKIQVFGEVSRSQSQTKSEQLQQFNVGNIVIKAGNPFIPSSVAQQMTALGIPQFNLGTMNGDIPAIRFEGDRVVTRLVAGLEGKFDVFGETWSWDAYYQKGITRSYETGYNISYKSRFSSALDAVTSPTTGAPVCRVTLTNPSSNCLPYDPMGLNVNSQATLNYLLGSPHRYQRFTQDVTAATLRGEPFNIWAGPVSIAVGVEHRREAVKGAADANSLVNGWFAGNYLPTFGSYRVTEGFAETVIPLLKNLPFAQALDFNGALRRTDYSTSGLVTTWKLGATWQPIDDFHFRTTRSRDIRAPNLNDLFAAGTANTNSVIDPFNHNILTAYQGKAVGNPNLQPEVADTFGYGIVLTPRFVPGFEASVDYYDIKIHDAIGTVDPQTIVNNCFEGNQTYCAAITRGTGAGGTSVITQIRILPFNLVELRARGVDLEASYRFNLASIVNSWGGGLTVHALATHYLENYQNNGINPPVDSAGSIGTFNGATTALPSWIFNSSITYAYNPITLTVTGRGFSAGTNSNQYTQCTSGCPLSTPNQPTINDNHAPGAFYVDLSGSYKFDLGSGEIETFATITNVANRDPGIVPQGPTGLAYAEIPTNPQLYDILGRVYRVGVRMKF
jgi:outer membrane receptor protein involved in Fe transport